MSKELSLQELMKNTQSSNTVVNTTGDIKTAKEVSISSLAQNLPGKEEKEEIKETAIVDNAFKAMASTLAEKKRYISEEVMPIVEENARQIALDNELSQLGTEESKEESLDINDIKDDYEDIDENEIINTDADPTPLTNTATNIATNITDFKFENKVEVQEQETAFVEDEKEEAEDRDTNINKTVDDALSNDISDIDSLLNDVENDLDDEEEEDEQIRERLKRGTSKIKIMADSLDLSKFTIQEKPVSSSTILNTVISAKAIKKADWALLATGRSITMTECSGPELDALRKTMNNSNNINSVINALKLLYNHTEDANKPSFEVWCKSIKIEDLESLYFALYKACYSDINIIGRTCIKEDKVANTGCGKTSAIEHDINKMVKFDDKEAEEKFNKIFQGDTTTSEDMFKSTLIAASDTIAISYMEPTLYSAIIQFSTLNPDLLKKYEDMLNTLAYITGFYYIDSKNNKLIPMAIKEYPNNLNKTVLNKLKVYSQILKSLTTDQYDVLTIKLSTIVKESKVKYVLPEVVCPECGHTIEEEPAGSMLDLVFQRRQLAQIRAL